jgi:uncharacterized protein
MGFRSDSFEISSARVGDRFSISVTLPPGYRDHSEQRYPVLYATDAFAHCAVTIAATCSLIFDGLRPVQPYVLVNVGHAETDFRGSFIKRNRDFLPRGEPVPAILERHVQAPGYAAILGNEQGHDEFMHQARNGRAHDFLAFIQEELHQEILRRFQVIPEHAGLFGHSYGGLFSLYAFTSGSSFFNRLCAASPGILVEDSVVYSRYLDLVKRGVASDWNVDLYLSLGEMEITGSEELYRQLGIGTLRFVDLVKKSPLPRLRVDCSIMEGENHVTGVLGAFSKFVRHTYAVT